MTELVTLCVDRLTYNFGRKGGFKLGGEDYRWIYMREKMGELRFQLMNCTFIAFGQMLIVWLFTSPVHHVWLNRGAPLNWVDALATALFLMYWVGEAVADQQQWNFQQEKKRKIEAGEEITEPFITTGLFAYCRHPNFFCEVSIWWVIYLFAIASTGTIAALVGCRRHRSQPAFPRLDPTHRNHHSRKVSFLPELSGTRSGFDPDQIQKPRLGVCRI